jgi:oligopeptidase B
MRKIHVYFSLLMVLALSFLVVSYSPKGDLTPPVAKIEPKIMTEFGKERIDNYYWLRDRDNPEVMKYLEAENAYTDTMMAHTKPLQETLFQEMVGRIKETDTTAATKWDDYYYYSRTLQGKQYSVECRKYQSLDAPEEVLLDGNKEAEGKSFWDLGIFATSPNHKLLALAIDTVGNERFTLRIKDLATGTLYPDKIDSVGESMQWANDNQTFFYVKTDEAWRPSRLFRHKLGEDVTKDDMVYFEKDEAFNVEIRKSKNNNYLFMKLESETSTEEHFLDANKPNGKFKVIQPRQKEVEYSVSQRGDKFYIVTNDNAKNFKLMEVPLAHPSKENWTEVIPYRKEVKLDNVEVFQDYMVLYEREGGLQRIQFRDFATGKLHPVEFQEPVYSYDPGWNPNFDSKTVRYVYTSLVTPSSVYEYDMKTHKQTLIKQDEILGGYDPNQYQEERIWATAKDGVKVPISMVYRKGMVKDGNNPLYLDGYGAYGASTDPYFSFRRLSLLDRGFIFAIAHIRGGGEMGRYWYDDGKMLHKKNTFTDFIACAEYVIQEKYTSKEKLVINGGSAGGLLIGAVVNLRPDLFKAVIADVPFVDLINTMSDPTIPLTVIEYEEWGNPGEKQYYDYMLSYSPYDNVRAQDYPNMFIEAGLNDTRVAYWEPSKWTAKLREMKTDNNRLYLHINMGAGHGGASGRYDFMREIALEYAFALDVLGMTK